MSRRWNCADCAEHFAPCSPEHDDTARNDAALAETRANWPTPGSTSPWDVPLTDYLPRDTVAPF